MLIYLDTETTGVEESDVMCAVGVIYSCDDAWCSQYSLVNEGKKIPSLASSIHHITPPMIKDKKPFIESEIYKLLELNNNPNTTIIAHHAAFDIAKLALAGLVWKGGVIDTLRVTKHLIPECELFSLQVLRYELQLYKDEKDVASKCGIKDAIQAHNALSDALVLKQLYDYLHDMATEEEMQVLSQKKVLLSKFNFGKYKNRYVEEIVQSDRGYLEWMLNLSDIDEDLRYSLEYYLQG